ncbi:MAG: VanZ family protein [Burkholderiaceae bacterium]
MLPGPLVHTLVRSDAARLVWRVALLLLMGVIAWLALTPKPPPGADLGWDKLNHACAFATLAAAGWFSVRARNARAWLLCGLLIYGGLIEIAQTQVPGRSGEWADLLADAVGLALGALLAAAVDAAAGRAVTPSRSRGSTRSG